MTQAEYLTVQHRLEEIAESMQELDLSGYLDAISRAEAVGPIVDPTLYMHGSPTMFRFRRLAEKALSFKFAGKEFLDYRAELRAKAGGGR